jgi:glycosyltransferase involved in cell wall biosynthesis/SAM-dependent methyltransferase
VRIAFFSPMPPATSGIADYSAALLKPLRDLADVDVFAKRTPGFDPGAYDAVLYQLGNNPDHAFVYETALEHPGTVVLHEANLHHLIADITIRRGDWDGYLREVEFDGGVAALARAQRVRALEIGPDYEGLPMIRRILSRSKAAIVHSRFVESRVRAAGFARPVGVIPHGAWIPEADGAAYRRSLGLGANPLIGIFGHLKPYKRIRESLRAFRRVVDRHPEARMILVGEPHPELALEPLIASLRLDAHVRVLGRAATEEEFTGYIAACDIALNLRFPTVGETSGTLLRALGLGRAVLVSDVGAFAEFPDDICLKTPIGAGEEDLLFEYLHLLIARPDLAAAMGARAREWVSRECSWEIAARRYVEFLSAPEAQRPVLGAEKVAPAAVTVWTDPQPDAGGYVATHLSRFTRTLEITPRGTAGDRVLEMGAYLHITPGLRFTLGYGEVRGCYFGPAGKTETRTVVSGDGREFTCAIDLFDAERDVFPYPDGYFSTVLCCELIEHLPTDPMHMMVEINRVLKPGGHLVLTTPNIAGLRAIHAVLEGYHPGFFPAYLLPETLAKGDSRHNREYTAREIHMLLNAAGFDVALLETGPFREQPRPELLWVERLLEQLSLDTSLRGDGIYAVGRKSGPPRERYPAWLYSG